MGVASPQPNVTAIAQNQQSNLLPVAKKNNFFGRDQRIITNDRPETASVAEAASTIAEKANRFNESRGSMTRPHTANSASCSRGINRVQSQGTIASTAASSRLDLFSRGGSGSIWQTSSGARSDGLPRVNNITANPVPRSSPKTLTGPQDPVIFQANKNSFGDIIHDLRVRKSLERSGADVNLPSTDRQQRPSTSGGYRTQNHIFT